MQVKKNSFDTVRKASDNEEYDQVREVLYASEKISLRKYIRSGKGRLICRCSKRKCQQPRTYLLIKKQIRNSNSYIKYSLVCRYGEEKDKQCE